LDNCFILIIKLFPKNFIFRTRKLVRLQFSIFSSQSYK